MLIAHSNYLICMHFIFLVISTAVIMVIGGVLIAAATVGIICCRTKGTSKSTKLFSYM